MKPCIGNERKGREADASYAKTTTFACKHLGALTGHSKPTAHYSTARKMMYKHDTQGRI